MGPFIDELNEVAADWLKVDLYYRGEHPYAVTDFMSIIRDNKVQMVSNETPYSTSVEPIMGLVDLPFFLEVGWQTYYDLVEDPQYQDLVDEILYNPLARWNQVPLITWAWMGQQIAVKDRFVEDFDSLKGVKIRAHTEPLAKLITALNGTPVPIPWGEVYPALQKGIVDGFCAALSGSVDAKLFEAIKYSTIVEEYPGPSWIAVNASEWAKLSDAQRGVILKLATKHQDRIRDRFETDLYRYYQTLMTQYGGHVAHMSPTMKKQLREKLQPYYDEWAQRTGPPAPELLERLRQYNEEWVKSH